MWHQIILLMNENSIKIKTTCIRSQLRVTQILRRRGSQINVLINEGDKLSFFLTIVDPEFEYSIAQKHNIDR